MLSLLFALVIGTGLFLVYDALTAPRAPRPPEAPEVFGRVRVFLAEAGLPSRPWEFVGGSIILGLVALWVAVATVHWPVLSLCTGAAGGLLPTFVVARLADRRQAALRVALSFPRLRGRVAATRRWARLGQRTSSRTRWG